MSTFVKISKLVGECLNIPDYYVNLDTGRKNKTSTMNSKKDIYISHNFKIFSIHRTTLCSNIKLLQGVYPHIKSDIDLNSVDDPSRSSRSNRFANSDDNTQNIGDGFIPVVVSSAVSSVVSSAAMVSSETSSYDIMTNAFNTINRLLVAQLMAEK